VATKRQRRKRRRRQTTGITPAPAPQPRRAEAVRRGDDRPPALWGDFPLTEIVIFIGLVLLVAGFFIPPPQGFVMIAVGLGLGSLAGLELAIREHYAGYRSHNLLLAAAIAVPLFGALYIASPLSVPLCIAVGLLAFGGAAWLFASAFRRRSGGALYRLRG
jgi:hypothetical protein